MSCEALNFSLKRLIKQERPKQMNGKGYGMPSSHAQFVSFWAVAVSLFLLVRHRPRARRKGELEPLTLGERAMVASVAISLAGAVTASRVYLNYHTPEQTLVGAGAGVFSAGSWFAVTELLRRQGWTAALLELNVAKMMRVRDLTMEEDLPAAGWEKWQKKSVDTKKNH